MKPKLLSALVLAVGLAGFWTADPASAISYCQLDPATDQTKYNEYFQPTCHNCYEIGVANKLGAKTFKEVLDQVKVVEVDFWDTRGPVTDSRPNHWFVRHSAGALPQSGNDNNCTGNGKGTNDLSACLKDVKEWSDAHPGHLPITVFLDKKQGFSSESSKRRPADLDKLVEDQLGAKLYTPSALQSASKTVRDAARADGWPALGDLAGKVILVLTADNDLLHEYVKDRLGNAALFVAARADKEGDVDGVPSGFSADTANYVVFSNISFSESRVSLGITARQNNFLARIYFGDDKNTCRVLANCDNLNALFLWNTGACSTQSSGTERLLDPKDFLPLQMESVSNFTCPASTVMSGRWHDCRNKADAKCDENGDSSLHCRAISYNGQAFGVGAGSESADVKESAGTAYLCPKDTVLIGRRHNCRNKGDRCDENGTTNYRCAPLTYQGQPVKIDPNAGTWSQEMMESRSQFVCPNDLILNGRKHTFDENGPTSYHCIPVPVPTP